MQLEIEPREWERGKVLKVAGKNKIIEPSDFVKIMDYIREDAIKRYGPEVDKPFFDKS